MKPNIRTGEEKLHSETIPPFRLKPVGKDYLWGGERLEKEFGKKLGMYPLAETWECSTHPDGACEVADGIFKGQTLDKVVKKNPELLGEHPIKVNGKGQFPILIKFIDAGQDASIQVHPDDSYATVHENGQQGKAELWYVLDAEPDAELIYGFHQTMDAQKIKAGIENGEIEKYLNKVPVQKDDVFFIPPGCVHAIGKGIVLAEIQQNSNLTYRLYDYNRRDKNGEKRALHVDKAMDVANFSAMGIPVQPMRVLRYQPGCATELLCRCKYFQVERLLVNTNERTGMTKMEVNKDSFAVLLCLEGEGSLGDKRQLKFQKGDCIFIPANNGEVPLEGSAQFLKIRC